MRIKRCSICGEQKLLSGFYFKDKVRVDGTPYVYYNPECKECTSRRSRKWQIDNQEEYVKHKYEYNTKRRIENPVIAIKDREHAKKQREDGYQKEYQQKNKDKIKQYNLNREMHKKHEISSVEWIACKKYFNFECAYCGLPIEEHFKKWNGEPKQIDFHKEHVDHEGSNDLSNCVPSCHSCNSKKWKFSLDEWYDSDNPNFTLERLQKINNWLSKDYMLYIK